MAEIVLTPELALKRQQARRVFPNCVWLPGDECPIGAHVLRLDDEHAVVIGESRTAMARFWWLLELADGTIVLDWPPSLRRAAS